MCSRFEMNVQPRELARRFGLAEPPPAPNATELYPTNHALVIDGSGGAGAEGRLLAWGLRVDWSPKPLINARAETLAGKRTFRPLLEHRCLVPATAYFEWRKDGPAKLKNRIAPTEGGAFAFAGLTDGERFTIVTCAPTTAIAHIHNRMPVILDPAGEGPWIDPDQGFSSVAGLLVPYAAEPLAAEEEEPQAETSGSDLFSGQA